MWGKIGCKCWFSLMKICVAALTLMIAKLWPPILSLNWYWYLLIAIAIVVIAMIKSKMCSCDCCKAEKKVVKTKKKR